MTLKRKKSLTRQTIKRIPVRRCWKAANAKVENKPCRYCGGGPIQRAHLVGRRYDQPIREGSKTLRVDPDGIVELCGYCHLLYDAYRLPLIGLLTISEYRYCLRVLGKERARRRLSGGQDA